MVNSIDEFIAKHPTNIQDILQKIRRLIATIVPQAQEAMVYGVPTFKLNGKNLVHFSAFKHHIGFYPTPSAIKAFKKDLASYKTAEGTIQFSLDKPIPYDLIKQITKFRIAEINTKNES